MREHVAGLVRDSVPISQIRGVLSDTVDWLVYDANLTTGINPRDCKPDDSILNEIDSLEVQSITESAANCLIAFLRKHLARQQSRSLRADYLRLDLGLESAPYTRNVGPLEQLVNNGRSTDPSIELVTDLWTRFVNFLEGVPKEFSSAAYVDEVYLCVLARLLGANVLTGHAILSDASELMAILDGSFFSAHHQLANVVEQDYFGWLSSSDHIVGLIPIAREIQHDLYAYDFGQRPEEDLFGQLLTQLARRSQRKLLGQEWTPRWLSHLLAERCVDNLPEDERPNIVDMCCGSGTILAETIKAVRRKFGFSDISELQHVVTGFDIDPLAVTLSKTAWVLTLAEEIKASTNPITIPIYHADSLFATTPITKIVPFVGEAEFIDISLDGAKVQLPNALVQPEYRDLFDKIVFWAHDEAIQAQNHGSNSALTPEVTAQFLHNAVMATHGQTLPTDLMDQLKFAVFELVWQMSKLAMAGRNGIWAFILRNTYRPGFLAGQFNGLVSNPPWLAMSALADNPYLEALKKRADLYGVRPPSQSFLHLELGTTHLLHAIDRYLAPGAAIACLVPGTILDGNHHEPFRRQKYKNSKRPVPLEITEVWKVEHGTFKYPGAVVFGRRYFEFGAPKNLQPDGFIARKSGLESVEFSTHSIGTEHTAWVIGDGRTSTATNPNAIMPQQGADLMPRTAVCVVIMDTGSIEYRVDTPAPGTDWDFTVKAAKTMKNERFGGYVAKDFIYPMAQSENLLPYLFGDSCAPVALPYLRDDAGIWKDCSISDIRRLGFTETARRFNSINERLATVGQGKLLHDRIDERGKLTKQIFGTNGFLVLSGAGGKYICAALIPVSDAQRLVVDQTLYWQVIADENEAWFRVAMLNSHSLTVAISPFNPKGDFGERHLHTLPYRCIPEFDPGNNDYLRLSKMGQKIADTARLMVKGDPYLDNPSNSLPARRRRLRNRLSTLAMVQEAEHLCGQILGTNNAS